MKTTSVLVTLAMCAGAWQGCSKASEYAKKGKASEAEQNLKAIYNGAREYYMDMPMAPGTMAPPRPQLPGPNVGPTPAKGACCQNGGKCTPEATQWEVPTWEALKFMVADPHYYSYEYRVEGAPGATDGSHNFTVFAYGDLDCDGEFSTYSITGAVDASRGEGVTGSGAVAKVKPNE